MKRIVCGFLVALLAMPAIRADEKPKEEKKPPTPKEQYQALAKEFMSERQKIISEIQKTKGPEQKKLIQKYMEAGKDFAEKFYKLADDNSKDPVATDAYFWIVQNAMGSPPYAKAIARIKSSIAEMPLAELSRRFNNNTRLSDESIMEAIFKRVEKDEKEPAAVDLLSWLAVNGVPNPDTRPLGQKASKRLIEKFPDHPGVERLCMVLGQGFVPDADETLKLIFEKATKERVKAAAALGIAKTLATKTDELGDKPAELDKTAAEAEKYFTMVIDQYGKDNAALKSTAEKELKSFRTFRVGKEAPDIKAADLDEKEFKLTDYRGKVVLLDFWGNW